MNPAPTLTVGASPHWRTGAGIPRMNYAHILMLLPTVMVGALAHSMARATAVESEFRAVNSVVQMATSELGLDSSALWLLGTVGTITLGIGGGILAEYLSQVAMRQPYRATDGHGAYLGLLLALMMPPTVPWWVLLVGVAVTLFIGKQIYGGIGGYPMHPAAVGWLVLMLSWPNHIYPVEAASIASAHPIAVIATAAGGIALCAIRYIRWQLPVAVLIGVLVTSLAFSPWLDDGIAAQFLSGHVMLGAFFLASDSTTSPANNRPMWLYGLGMGFMIVLIRAFGIWPDAVPFAVLLMNAISPLLDRIRPQVLHLGGAS